MTRFVDSVSQETPRLVVMFRRGEDGKDDQFQWGVIGQIPMLSLIGAIVRVQGELYFRSPNECPEQALVIIYDSVTKAFDWFVHPDVPVDAMAGMLEAIKFTITASRMAQQKANQQVILGPDGLPIKR